MIDDDEPMVDEQPMAEQARAAVLKPYAAAQSYEFRTHFVQQRRKDRKRAHEEEQA